jgi:hypothetical protein
VTSSTEAHPDTGSVDSSTGSTTTTTATESTGGGQPTCPIDDHFQCDVVPYDCSAVDEWSPFHCGAPTAWFDEHGCLRQACDDRNACPSGFECFDPREACGACIGPRPTCDEISGADPPACGCGNDGECHGLVCVPAELLEGDPCDWGGTSGGSSGG